MYSLGKYNLHIKGLIFITGGRNARRALLKRVYDETIGELQRNRKALETRKTLGG
jgi:hypothetical protein